MVSWRMASIMPTILSSPEAASVEPKFGLVDVSAQYPARRLDGPAARNP